MSENNTESKTAMSRLHDALNKAAQWADEQTGDVVRSKPTEEGKDGKVQIFATAWSWTKKGFAMGFTALCAVVNFGSVVVDGALSLVEKAVTTLRSWLADLFQDRQAEPAKS